jgi:hypothetical protein
LDFVAFFNFELTTENIDDSVLGTHRRIPLHSKCRQPQGLTRHCGVGPMH